MKGIGYHISFMLIFVDRVGNVKWLQPTYNLSTELNEFVGDFITRSKNHNDNHWIIKPPNMARSLDMVITDNLDTILRFYNLLISRY